MRSLQGPLFAAALCLVTAGGAGALDVTVGHGEIERALAIARASEAERARFHRRYIFPVSDATVTQLEIISEFRRFVIAGEDRLRHGDWMFTRGTHAAEQALAPWRGLATIAVRLRFHPLNTYISVPPVELTVGVKPVAVRTTPQFAVALPGQKNTATSLLGAVIEADFPTASLGQTTRSIQVVLDGKELAKLTVDFAQIQ